MEDSVARHANFSEKLDIQISVIALNLKFLFFFSFLAGLSLRCCTWAFSSCGERGLLFVAVRGLFIAVASLVAEHWL